MSREGSESPSDGHGARRERQSGQRRSDKVLPWPDKDASLHGFRDLPHRNAF